LSFRFNTLPQKQESPPRHRDAQPRVNEAMTN
jgi:hypothetical protein